MNLLHIIGSMDPCFGGPGQVVRSSIQELERLGVRNEVVCLDDPEAPFLQNDVFKIYPLGPRKGPWYYSPKLLRWLLENLECFNVIIVHGLWLYHNYAINKAIRIYQNMKKERRQNVKVFIMPHGMLDPYFQRVPERRLKALRNWAYWKLIEGKTVTDAEGLLFTCEQELKLARQSFHPYKPKREINVGCGISAPPSFSLKMYQAFRKICSELKDSSYLLFLGRIHQKKGVDILINAYAEILKKISSKELKIPKLVIAGPDLESTYGQKVKRMVSENACLDNMVLFPGMLTGDAKWGALYGCEAFVLPSHQENFGIAVVEALACGKPVLISNKVNIWREIKDGNAGLVAEDSQEEAEYILKEWLNMSAVEKQIMGERARATYEEHFEIHSSVKKLLNAIKIDNSKISFK